MVLDGLENVTLTSDCRGKWIIRWDDEPGNSVADVFISSNPRGSNWGNPILIDVTAHAEFFVQDELIPIFVKLESRGKPFFIVGERAPRLTGGVNFRDVGGYKTEDGRWTNWGQIYRSGHLSNLTEQDKKKIEERKVRKIYDFRTAEESSNEKTVPLRDTDLRVIGIPPGIGDKRYFHRLFAENVEPAPVVDAMHRMFTALIRDYADYFRFFFEMLLEDCEGALLLNCSAGKERTGTGVALLLSALDVPVSTIMYDFMLSERYYPIESEIPRALAKYEVPLPGIEGRNLIMPLLETRKSYIESIFETISNDYGSVYCFLEKKCGVGKKERLRLKELYTTYYGHND